VIPDLIAFVIFLPFRRSQPMTDPKAMQELISGFQARGVEVISSHPRCNEKNLYGLYIRGSREIVVCERGDQTYTLRHEGWHLVQSLCLQGKQWLTSVAIENELDKQDRAELSLFVRMEGWTKEAEARVMAKKTPKQYFEEFDSACWQPINTNEPYIQ
jgi:hypothetical protein